MTGEEMMKQIEEMEKIKQNIHAQFPDVDFPDPILEPLYYGRLDKTTVEGRKLVLDKKTGNQFDIVSDQYKVVTHEEILHKLLEGIPEEFGAPKISAKLWYNGARGEFTAVFPEMGKFEVQGSAIDPKVVLKNSYDRSSNLKFDWGAVEQICTNGLRAFVSKSRGSAKHIEGSVSKLELQQKIQTALGSFSEQHGIWLKWAERKLTEIEVKTVIAELPFTEKEQERLFELPLMNHNNMPLMDLKSDMTLWAVNSAATQYAQHHVESIQRRVDLEGKIMKGILSGEKKLAA